MKQHSMYRYIAIVLVLVLGACETPGHSVNPTPRPTTRTIETYSDPAVQRLSEELPVRRTLFVFDIDNTLLESPGGQFLGSDQWYKWQKTLSENSPKKVECVLQVQGAAYYMAHLEPTENGSSADYVRSLQSDGFDVMALTARSPQFRSATIRELANNGFDFNRARPARHPGFPGVYEPQQSKLTARPRSASYQDGVAMLAGQHKGAALIDLLERLGAHNKYTNIVFFDDDEKNTNAMSEAYLGRAVDVKIFLYKAVDTDLSQYDLNRATEGQRLLQDAFARFSRRAGCDV